MAGGDRPEEEDSWCSDELELYADLMGARGVAAHGAAGRAARISGSD